MGQHTSHEMHENSLKAHEEELPKLSKRADLIYSFVASHAGSGGFTDRGLMRLLGFSDPNCVRPRITELVKAGLLVECDKTTDPTTGKTVRTVRARAAQMSLI